jgi:uncharacterized protein (DUF736 family)
MVEAWKKRNVKGKQWAKLNARNPELRAALYARTNPQRSAADDRNSRNSEGKETWLPHSNR